MIIKKQELQEMQFPNIDVVEIPLKQFTKTKIFSQGQISQKNNKYQIPLLRLQQKQNNVLTEPIKQPKSVRFNEYVEIIDEQLYQQILSSDQYAQQQQKNENTSMLPLMPMSKLSFPIKLDQIRQNVEKDIQFFNPKPSKTTSTQFEIPKRFRSVSRQDKAKKINRSNNSIEFDPWNINYAFAPLSARLQYEQQKSSSLNSSYSLLQDYSEQYSHRNYYNPNNSTQNNNVLNNSILLNKSNIYMKNPSDQKYQCTSPQNHSTNSSRNSQYNQPYSFQETSSNYKSFAPTLSNTPSKIYNSSKMDSFTEEQENSENFPMIFKTNAVLKSITPNNYYKANRSIQTTQQSVNSSYTLKTKDDEEEEFGEMLSQFKNHITLKKQKQNSRKQSPKKLKKLPLELSNITEQIKNIKYPQKSQNHNVLNQVNQQIKNKLISDKLKNALLKNIKYNELLEIS